MIKEFVRRKKVKKAMIKFDSVHAEYSYAAFPLKF